MLDIFAKANMWCILHPGFTFVKTYVKIFSA